MTILRVALLHLAPRTGDLGYNRSLVRGGVAAAAALGAHWVVTPELCLSGYEFSEDMGIDWISPQPDGWMQEFCRFASGLGVTVFLANAEKDPQTSRLHNTVFVVGVDGMILGAHRKTIAIPGVESWSTPGVTVAPVRVPPLTVGILICADSYRPDNARSLHEQGAEMLISSAAWTPRPHGPENCWEDRTRETGLPLFVCNRTGADKTLDFSDAQTVVAKDGKRLLTFESRESALVLVDWDLQTQTLLRHESHPVSHLI